MRIIEQNGKVLLQQHEGNRQLASALADSAPVLLRRLTKSLAMLFVASQAHNLSDRGTPTHPIQLVSGVRADCP
jgi:hypothetical protein